MTEPTYYDACALIAYTLIDNMRHQTVDADVVQTLRTQVGYAVADVGVVSNIVQRAVEAALGR
jgi:hypothetical protein